VLCKILYNYIVRDGKFSGIKFTCTLIHSISDCIAAPEGALVFLSLYHPLGDIRSLLTRDPHSHVIGETHAQWVAAGVLLAADFLHTRNVVHGNIKASKVLINNLGYPVLVSSSELTFCQGVPRPYQ